MNAGNKNTPSTHHPRRRNVTTLMVGLKKRSHTQKSHPKVVNPRDIAGERQKQTNKQQQKNPRLGKRDPRRKGGSNLRSAAFEANAFTTHRLVGLVVRRPPRERKVQGSNPACAGIFSGSSHTSDFKLDTPAATLTGAWRYRVSTGTGRPGVSIL